MTEMEIYGTEQEAVLAAEAATRDSVPLDPGDLFGQMDRGEKTTTASVFLYDLEGTPCFGEYELKEGDMATYGLAATCIGAAVCGKFERHGDEAGEIGKKMMGLW